MRNRSRMGPPRVEGESEGERRTTTAEQTRSSDQGALDARSIQLLVYDNKFKNRFKLNTSNASRAENTANSQNLTVLLF